MSKTLRTVAVIAGAVAVIAATGGVALGALAPAGMAGTATVAGTGITAATLSSVPPARSAVGSVRKIELRARRP